MLFYIKILKIQQVLKFEFYNRILLSAEALQE